MPEGNVLFRELISFGEDALSGRNAFFGGALN